MQVTVMNRTIEAYNSDVARLVAHLKGYDHLDIEYKGKVKATGPSVPPKTFGNLEEFIEHCLY